MAYVIVRIVRPGPLFVCYDPESREFIKVPTSHIGDIMALPEECAEDLIKQGIAVKEEPEIKTHEETNSGDNV